MLRGRLLTESLRIGADVRLPDLRVTRLGRQEVSGTTPDQPDVWTYLDFEGPDEVADGLAEALAAALRAPGWYADFEVAADHVIIYPGRVFRYAKGDAAAREEAAAYGRALGVPESQLDWGD